VSPLLRRSETRIVRVSVLFLQRLLLMNPQTCLCRRVSFVVSIGDASIRDASPPGCPGLADDEAIGFHCRAPRRDYMRACCLSAVSMHLRDV
jgi:hypothetical protein